MSGEMGQIRQMRESDFGAEQIDARAHLSLLFSLAENLIDSRVKRSVGR